MLEIEHGGQCYGAGAALFWLEPVGLLMRNLLYEKENIILHLSTTSGSVSFMKILLYLSRWTAFQRRRDHFRDKDKEKCTRSTVGTSSPIVFFSGCSNWSKLTGSLGWILRRRTHHWNWNVPVTQCLQCVSSVCGVEIFHFRSGSDLSPYLGAPTPASSKPFKNGQHFLFSV